MGGIQPSMTESSRREWLKTPGPAAADRVPAQLVAELTQTVDAIFLGLDLDGVDRPATSCDESD